MLATLVSEPFSDRDWIFETKWDGFRSICFLNNGKARFVSRNQLDMTPQYPELANAGDLIDARQAILDGEIVALDARGRPRFQLLQPRHGRKHISEISRLARRSAIVYYIFDLLYYNGFDLMSCPLIERKAFLERILRSGGNIRYSEHIAGDGELFFEQIEKFRLEGMMAKKAESKYVEKRSRDWLKIKTVRRSEVVVGGYTEPRGSRSYFGALVVGLYRKGELHCVAHVGGGFSERSLAQVYQLLEPLNTKKCPFAVEPQTNEPVQWVKPSLVAEVRFSEWTADGFMRQPIFVGLREDKQPEECVFEGETRRGENG